MRKAPPSAFPLDNIEGARASIDRTISSFSHKKASTQFSHHSNFEVDVFVSKAPLHIKLSAALSRTHSYANGTWASINTQTLARPSMCAIPLHFNRCEQSSLSSYGLSVHTRTREFIYIIWKCSASATENEWNEKRNICEQCAIWIWGAHNWLLYIFSQALDTARHDINCRLNVWARANVFRRTKKRKKHLMPSSGNSFPSYFSHHESKCKVHACVGTIWQRHVIFIVVIHASMSSPATAYTTTCNYKVYKRGVCSGL